MRALNFFRYPDHYDELPWTRSSLGAWLFVTMLFNVIFATGGGYGGDIAYWKDWITQLQAGGYARLDANYPPVYVHWLWLVGKLHSFFNIPVVADTLLRALANAPTMLAHLALLATVHHIASRNVVSPRHYNLLLGFTALNPAILVNGPLWGQVDLLFSVMLVVALMLLIERRHRELVFPLLFCAVLTKFQAICIGPALLPLLWLHRSRSLWRGLGLALLLATWLLLPYLVAGNLGRMVDLTYLQAASLYPFATYNGYNLWYLIGLNARPDNLYIFNFLNATTPWQKLFTPKVLGIALFGAWSVWLMVSSSRRDESARHWRNAFLAALGFFLFLPAMHERYMLAAAVIALAAAARHPCFTLPAVALTLLSAGNMLMTFQPSGGLVAQFLSLLSILVALLVALPPRLLERAGAVLSIRLRWWVALTALTWLAVLSYSIFRAMPVSTGWIDATRIPGRTATQEWGDLSLGHSVGSNPMSVGKQVVSRGFGTHASSTIRLLAPVNAASFSTSAGMDDESPGGEAEFIVRVDGIELWKSGPMKTGDVARKITLPVRAGQAVELVVDPLGSNAHDHADWLEPGFFLHQDAK